MGWKSRLAAVMLGTMAVAAPLQAQAAPHDWTPQQLVNSDSAYAPALASCDHFGSAILVWKRTTDHRMAYRIYTIQRGWGLEQLLGGAGGTSGAPTVACGHHGYYVAWKGIDPDRGIYYTTSRDGQSWTPQQRVGGSAETYARPSIAVARYVYGDVQVSDVVHVAWKHSADDPRIYYTKRDIDFDPDWTPRAAVGGGSDPRYWTSAPPTLSYEFGRYDGSESTPGIVWTGSGGDSRVRYAALQRGGGVADPAFVAAGNATTERSPSAAAQNQTARQNAPGDGMVLWKAFGPDGGSIWHRAPGTGDQPQRLAQVGGASEPPAFAYLELRSFSGSRFVDLVAWKGSGSDTRLFYTFRER